MKGFAYIQTTIKINKGVWELFVRVIPLRHTIKFGWNSPVNVKNWNQPHWVNEWSLAIFIWPIFLSKGCIPSVLWHIMLCEFHHVTKKNASLAIISQGI